MKEKNQHLSKEEILNLIEDYKSGIKMRFLVQKYQKAKSSIKRWLTIFNVTRQTDHRRHTINDNYFDIIDTENKAYLLGLFYADGCNHSSEARFSISLQEKDKYIIEWIKKELNSSHPIFKKTKLTPVSKESRDYYGISFASKRMCARLTELGCFPQKSLKLKFPTEDQVPNYLIHHFIRGYFDGDGSVCYRYQDGKHFKASCSFVGTMEFITKLKEILLNKADVKLLIAHRVGFYEEKYKNRNSNSFNTAISGSFQCEKMFNYLYKDAHIFFSRKFDNFMKIKNRPTKKERRKIKLTNIKTGEIKIINNQELLKKEFHIGHKTLKNAILTKSPINDYAIEYIQNPILFPDTSLYPLSSFSP
jgi:hypothetical protein